MVSLQPGQQEPYHTHGHPMFYYVLQVLTSDNVWPCDDILCSGHSDCEAEWDQEPGEEVAMCEYPQPVSSWYLQ